MKWQKDERMEKRNGNGEKKGVAYLVEYNVQVQYCKRVHVQLPSVDVRLLPENEAMTQVFAILSGSALFCH